MNQSRKLYSVGVTYLFFSAEGFVRDVIGIERSHNVVIEFHPFNIVRIEFSIFNIRVVMAGIGAAHVDDYSVQAVLEIVLGSIGIGILRIGFA